jgi:hypothetical protein
VLLRGKREYIFVDIFNHIDIDLMSVRPGAVNITLNGNRAAYTDVLKDGDIVEVLVT